MKLKFLQLFLAAMLFNACLTNSDDEGDSSSSETSSSSEISSSSSEGTSSDSEDEKAESESSSSSEEEASSSSEKVPTAAELAEEIWKALPEDFEFKVSEDDMGLTTLYKVEDYVENDFTWEIKNAPILAEVELKAKEIALPIVEEGPIFEPIDETPKEEPGDEIFIPEDDLEIGIPVEEKPKFPVFFDEVTGELLTAPGFDLDHQDKSIYNLQLVVKNGELVKTIPIKLTIEKSVSQKLWENLPQAINVSVLDTDQGNTSLYKVPGYVANDFFWEIEKAPVFTKFKTIAIEEVKGEEPIFQPIGEEGPIDEVDVEVPVEDPMPLYFDEIKGEVFTSPIYDLDASKQSSYKLQLKVTNGDAVKTIPLNLTVNAPIDILPIEDDLIKL